jgi:hypothetical protein
VTWKIALVPQEEIKAFWPKIAPLLVKAMSYAAGRTDMRSIYEAVQDGRQFLWIAFDDVDKIVAAAFVTHLAQYPKGAALVIDCAGGSQMENWLQIASTTFRKCARDMGAERVELYGRKGWARVLKSCGWQQKLVVLEIGAASAAEGA